MGGEDGGWGGGGGLGYKDPGLRSKGHVSEGNRKNGLAVPIFATAEVTACPFSCSCKVQTRRALGDGVRVQELSLIHI